MSDDTSLDDFFAKKDRSKKKQKNKKIGESINTYTYENTAQSREKPTQKKEKDKTQSGVNMQNAPNEPDEEWIDFEEKIEKDFTGLRIQNIQITNRVESENESDQRDGGDEEAGEEGREKEEVNQGPWNKTGATPELVPEPAVVVDKKAQPEPQSKYIPPSLRMENRNIAGRRKKKGAPDLKNEEEFPTLGSGPPPDWATQSKSFEAVRSGGRRVENTHDSLHLTLENKFAALS